MNGKGDKPRPFSVSQDEFGKRWDKINWPKSNTKTNETTNRRNTKTTRGTTNKS